MKTWKQKDGRRILLKDMTDIHLKNAISMLTTHIRALEAEDITDREIYSGFHAYIIEEDLQKKTNMRKAMQRELLSRKQPII